MAGTEAEAKPMRAGQNKISRVADLTERLGRATSAVVTDYRGMTVHELERLRSVLRKNGVEYVVVKNTLARRAAADAGLEDFAAVLTGPVGLAIGYDELSLPAKLLSDYFRTNKKPESLAAIAEKQVLDAKGVKMLSELPSRDALLAQLAGTLQSPLTQLAGSLDSILSTFAATLDAYRDKAKAA